jgi:uncharacterized integral membrane protein
VAFLGTKGISVYIYLDDILMMAPSPALVRNTIRHTVLVLLLAGLLINFTKSELSPMQDVRYIGGRFHTDLGIIFLSLARIEALLACICTILRVGSPPISPPPRSHGNLPISGQVGQVPIQWHMKDH